MTGDTLLWAVARAAGLVALVLLSLSLLLGVLTWSRLRSVVLPRALSAGVHRNVSLLALSFVALHVSALLADRYAHIRPLDLAVPFLTSYRPLFVGLGTLALLALVALDLSSVLQRRLGFRRWRALHWLAYACWPLALVHALGSGTDARAAWFGAVAAVLAALVLAVVLGRVAAARSASPSRRAVLGGLLVVGGVAVSTLAVSSDVRSAGRARLAVSRAPASALLDAPFRLALRGQVERSTTSDGSARLDLDGVLGERAGRLHATVTGTASADGVVPRTIALTLAPADTDATYSGTGRLSTSNEIIGELRAGDRRLEIAIDLAVDSGTGALTGSVRGQPATGLPG